MARTAARPSIAHPRGWYSIWLSSLALVPAGLELLAFDLDGTLIDSRADLVAAVHATLEHLGRPPLPADDIARYVGDGAAMLVARALGLVPAPDRSQPAAPPPALAPAEQALADRALAFFLDYYAAHKLDATTLYPGVTEGLAALAHAGFRMAVLTNKPVRASREIIAGLGLADRFFAVYGGNSFARKKPDPIGLEALLAACGLEPRRAVMIGDSAVDVRTGRNAGAWTLGAEYGFQPETFAYEPPDWRAPDFAVLTDLLLGFAPTGNPGTSPRASLE